MLEKIYSLAQAVFASQISIKTMPRKNRNGDSQRSKRVREAITKKVNKEVQELTTPIVSNFAIILRCLLYAQPCLPKEDADFLMRQSSPRLVDRANWQFTY